MLWRWLAAAALVAAAGSPAAAQALGLGDPAPRLEVKEFLKGSPLARLEPGRVHVVEFWATWCGPCRTTIPHLTALQKKYPAVHFIGVSILERNQGDVAPFVRQMGAKMGYRVAIDQVPPGQSGQSGKMARAWMAAAGQSSVPTAFIIDRKGRIAWIGHPAAMDDPLEKIVAGKWNIQAAIDEKKREARLREALTRLQPVVAAAQKSGDPRAAVAAIDRTIAADPPLEAILALHRLRLLMMPKGDPAKAAAYAGRLADGLYRREPEALNNLSWLIVAPGAPKPTAALAAVALRAAERADAGTGRKNAGVADTLARAQFVSGKAAAALATQERAMRLAAGTPLAKDPDMKKRLEEYRRAARKR